ncbi:MAG: 3-methyl-2-oxobutanoate dehydrogenase subunit VorB [Oscillospiraceae bacterium]|nr:3-methyl-2-oxobutanoate dehydrogenase subunit VorB [Oscillospiraceae bacterium]
MDQRVLMKGNEAIAEAVIQAGCLHFFGYPITPQNEINAYMSKRLPRLGGTYLQAESEIAAVNMLYGAAAAGIRAVTSSSSPGISLKTEGISYMCGADLPGLIINVQRGGPGLGTIQPSQADYFQATKAPGHGDLKILVYAPNTVQEMVDVVFTAFDLSDKYRVPAMLLADGILGQMMEPVQFPDQKPDIPAKPWATNGTKGERAPNIINSLYLVATELEDKVRERFVRYGEIEANHSQAENYLTDDADVLLVAYGASSRVAKRAINAARNQGIKAGMLRPVTLWPFPKKQLEAAAKNAASILTVEMSMGQMVEDVRLALPDRKVQFYGRTGGVIPTPEEILEQIKALGGGVK